MGQTRTIRLPVIGPPDPTTVRAVLVKPGDRVRAVQPLVEVESDKATLEIPSPCGGVVEELFVRAGQAIRHDTALLTMTED